MNAYALLGDPVDHSLSPRLHNAAFRALGIEADYGAIRCGPRDVFSLMRMLAGGNVTVPHKEVAASAVDHVSDVVRRTGACNTFYTRADGVHGENTDVPGFLAACAHHGVSLASQEVLVLGAGGAAAAVAAALLEAGTARITLCNRTVERAEALAARFADDRIVCTTTPVDAGITINATSLGLLPTDPHPLALDRVSRGILLDVVYGSRWIAAARDRGLTAFDGREMLLRQAAAAFELWTGREAPLDVMRDAIG